MGWKTNNRARCERVCREKVFMSRLIGRVDRVDYDVRIHACMCVERLRLVVVVVVVAVLVN